MAKDIHKKEFDDGTKIKLDIFREYLKEWLPTFTKRKEIIWKDIFIYDFFAGEGEDIAKNQGSPLIIIDELKAHHDAITNNNLNLSLILNEADEKKYKILKSKINIYENSVPYKIKPFQKKFSELFNEIYPKIIVDSGNPRLFFLDQYGIKEINNEVFKKIINLKRTDFIFFISSSYVRRFSEMEEFKSYIKINKTDFIESKPVHSHRVVYEYYKSLITDKNEYYLAPFSIKKGVNIYGLIFGSNHTLGIEKFLNIAWKINPNSGDANFNIDEEAIAEGQMSFFIEDNKPKKLTLFENKLKELILNKNLRTNLEVYKFSLDYGCLPKHANVVLNDLIKKGYVKPIRMVSNDIHNLATNNNIEKIELK